MIEMMLLNEKIQSSENCVNRLKNYRKNNKRNRRFNVEIEKKFRVNYLKFSVKMSNFFSVHLKNVRSPMAQKLVSAIT